MIRRTLVVSLLLVCAACAGPTARDEALLPAMAVSWQGVSQDVERGILIAEFEGALDPTGAVEARSASAAVGAALDSRDRSALILVDWGGLQALALRGIQVRASGGDLPDGVTPIGLGVAGSLVERISNFTSAWLEAIAR